MIIQVLLRSVVLAFLAAGVCCLGQEAASDEGPLVRADDHLKVFFHQLATLDDYSAYVLGTQAWKEVDPKKPFRPDEIATLADAMNSGDERSADAALEISILYLKHHREDKAALSTLTTVLPAIEGSFFTMRPSNLVVNGENLVDANHKILVLGFIRALGKQPAPPMVTWMIKTLSTYKPNVDRTEIITSLARLSPMREDALDALVSALDRTSDGSGGIDSILILGEIDANHLDSEKVRSAVIRALHSPVPTIQEMAIGSVTALHITAAEPALRAVITAHPDSPAAHRAADALRLLR
jgi:hypothetical protein